MCDPSFCHHPLSVDREEPWSLSAFCVYSGAFRLVLSDLSRDTVSTIGNLCTSYYSWFLKMLQDS